MNDDLIVLIDKYLTGEASENEKELVENWYQSFESMPGLMAEWSPEEAVKTAAENFAAISRKLDFC